MAALNTQDFGRIPPETVQLFSQSVSQAREEVLAALPANAGDEARAFTVEQVLAIVFRDWVENGNQTGLGAADVNDIKSFVKLAAALAGPELGSSGLPVFQATLKGLLEDWLGNWNADGDPGPPGPID